MTLLSDQEYKDLLVISELYRQQKEMHKSRSKRIDDRIVSISQPHIRPILRGKAKAGTEFGNYPLVLSKEMHSWKGLVGTITMKARLCENLLKNIKKDLASILKRYLPIRFIVIGKTEHSAKKKEFALAALNSVVAQRKRHTSKKLEKLDAAERNHVEAKFGEAKRHYGMGLISTRIQDTSETVIAIQLLVMNMERKLRLLFCVFIEYLFYVFSANSSSKRAV